MKKIKFLVYALIVSMSFVGVAEAKSRSGSFKSGFTSQKRSAPKPAPSYTVPPAAEQTKKTSFGSFGAASPKTQTNTAAPQSQMSKDLSDKAAQANALKTAEARNKTGEPSESGWFRSGNEKTATQKPQATNYGQAANNNANANTNTNANSNGQIFDRRNSGQQSRGSNGFMYGLLGFMIGNSLAQQATAGNYEHHNDWQNDNWNGNTNNSINADGSATQQVQEVPAEETESWFMKFVRVVLWAIVISSVIWMVRKVMNFRQRKINRSTNYSLGS